MSAREKRPLARVKQDQASPSFALFEQQTGSLPSTGHHLSPVPQTDQLPSFTRPLSPHTSPQRAPMIIRGSGTRRLPAARPSTRRRLLIQLAAASLLGLVLLTTALAVTPINSEGQTALGVIPPLLNWKNVSNTNTIALAQQQATATAVIRNPGYDPSSPTAPGNNGGDHFYYGQCTYWASYRYHQLTGIWVPWYGNAYQWTAGAQASGWTVSATPKKGAIIVLQPGIQGASYGYGHVAVVESINADGSVVTSNWNWNGMGTTTTYVTFKPGTGVSFLWESHLV